MHMSGLIDVRYNVCVGVLSVQSEKIRSERKREKSKERRRKKRRDEKE